MKLKLANTLITGKVYDKFLKYYQWLKLGEIDNIVNYGTGGDSIDGLIISGSMLGQDLVLNWTRNDAGLEALAVAYGISYPQITYAEMKALVTYPSYILKSENEINELFFNNSSQNIFGTTPFILDGLWKFKDNSSTQRDLNIVCYGNSITLGIATCGATKAYPQLLAETLISSAGQNVKYVNLGVGGMTGETMDLEYSIRVPQHFDSERENYLFVFEYINDIDSGKTSTQAYNNIQSVITKGKLTGFTVIALTAPYAPTVPTAGDSNNLLRDNFSPADYLIDQAELLDLSFMADIDNSCDGIHLKNLGIEQEVQFIYDDMISQDIISIANHDRNDVEIRNTNVIEFSSLGQTLESQSNITLAEDEDFEINFEITSTGIKVDFEILFDLGATLYFFVNRSLNGNRPVMLLKLTDLSFATVIVNNFVHDGSIFNIQLKKVGSVITVESNGILYGTTPLAFPSIAINSKIKFGGGLATTQVTGKLSFFDFINKINYPLIERDGVICYDNNAVRNDCILSDETMRSVLGGAKPFEIINGYTQFDNDSTLGLLNVSYYNGLPVLSTVTGYTKIADIQPNVESNSGNTLLGIKYLDWELNEKTFADIDAIVIPPKEDFRINNAEDVIKDMASQPY